MVRYDREHKRRPRASIAGGPVAIVGGGNSAGQAALFLETSRAGIFGVGDVRSGSVKRVAAAIGEGSIAVRLVFDRLQASGVASRNS